MWTRCYSPADKSSIVFLVSIVVTESIGCGMGNKRSLRHIQMGTGTSAMALAGSAKCATA